MSECKIKSHQSFHVTMANEGEAEILKQCFVCNATWHETIGPQPLTARESALANLASPDAQEWLYDAILSVYGQLSDDVVIAMSEYIEQRRKQSVAV